MSALPDPVQSLLMATLAAAVMFAAAPRLFLHWLSDVAERQRASMLRQQAIREELQFLMERKEPTRQSSLD